MRRIQVVLDEQQRYYDERAAEYDDWWYRRNAFDEGPDANARWLAEAGLVDDALGVAGLAGDVLELAAGTGIWSQKLLKSARTLTLVDGSAHMLARNPATADRRVRTVRADIFAWRAERTFDAVLFGFWISHVPRDLFPGFMQSVSGHLRPGGKFFFVDNSRRPEASAPHVVGQQGELMTRRLANGKTSTIVKNYYSMDEITSACVKASLTVKVYETPTLFQYGVGQRS
jgi:SAM-dependent methyltransferase